MFAVDYLATTVLLHIFSASWNVCKSANDNLGDKSTFTAAQRYLRTFSSYKCAIVRPYNLAAHVADRCTSPDMMPEQRTHCDC